MQDFGVKLIRQNQRTIAIIKACAPLRVSVKLQ